MGVGVGAYGCVGGFDSLISWGGSIGGFDYFNCFFRYQRMRQQPLPKWCNLPGRHQRI